MQHKNNRRRDFSSDAIRNRPKVGRRPFNSYVKTEGKEEEIVRINTENFSQTTKDKIIILAHELRTPLAVIRSLSEVGLKVNAGDAPKLEETIRSINSEVRKVSQTLEALLSDIHSTVQPKNKQPSPQKVNVSKIVNSVISSFSHLTIEKGIRITDFINGEITVFAQYEDISSIIQNVLSNAISHSPQGSEIKMLLDASDDNSYLLFSVSDSGPGFSEKDFDHLLKEQYQGDNPTAGGIGLGLAHVQSILEKYQGTITLENVPTGGAKVLVTIPIN